jgi:hypothetical protein
VKKVVRPAVRMSVLGRGSRMGRSEVKALSLMLFVMATVAAAAVALGLLMRVKASEILPSGISSKQMDALTLVLEVQPMGSGPAKSKLFGNNVRDFQEIGWWSNNLTDGWRIGFSRSPRCPMDLIELHVDDESDIDGYRWGALYVSQAYLLHMPPDKMKPLIDQLKASAVRKARSLNRYRYGQAVYLNEKRYLYEPLIDDWVEMPQIVNRQ